jgi:hypothetical protein
MQHHPLGELMSDAHGPYGAPLLPRPNLLDKKRIFA